MAYYECEQCDGYGTRFTWRWPFIVGCDACNGDGHARPPKDSVRPLPPPPPPLNLKARKLTAKVRVGWLEQDDA